MNSHSNQTDFDYAVIGAGYAGVSIAALLQKDGRKVALFDSHSTIGGCAGYYKRKKFFFDAGATTFSAMAPHEPVGKVFSLLNIKPNLIRLDPGMIILLNDKELIRYSNPDKWMESTTNFFQNSQKSQESFWKHMDVLNRRAFEFLDIPNFLPIRSLNDIFHSLNIKNLNYLSLIPSLFRSLKSYLNPSLVSDELFYRFLTEQLMITTQTGPEHAPLLTSAMGLSYPSSTYYPIGGMSKPALKILEKFQNDGGLFLKRTQIRNISHDNQIYKLESDSNSFLSKGIVSTLPIWNMKNITDGKIQAYYTRFTKKYPQGPAAFTVYFGVQTKIELKTCYYQIHLREKIPFTSAGAIFVSFSHPDDLEKAPEGFRTVTISIHTESEYFLRISKEEYQKRKEEVKLAILKEFDFHFPDLASEEKLFLEAGTPSTFEDYTGRMEGRVGGIAHSVRPSLLSLFPNRLPFPKFYQGGDTAFPGQGIPAVLQGSLQIYRNINYYDN